VKSALAEGELAFVDTPGGERFGLWLAKRKPGLKATAVISHPHGSETFPLLPLSEAGTIFESAVAPAEPHAFEAELQLSDRTKSESLPFKMEEPEGHGH
jgi:hypothetical protein